MIGGPRATLSLVAGDAPGSFVLACVDPVREMIRTTSLNLTLLSRDDRRLFWGHPSGRSTDPETDAARATIGDLLGDVSSVTLMLVPPRLARDAGGDSGFTVENAPPCGLYPAASPLLKVIYVLMQSGAAIAMATVMDTEDSESDIAIRRVDEPDLADRLPIFQKSEMVGACVELLTGRDATPRRRAAMAAALGAWPSAHAYGSSFGTVFSITDLTSILQSGQSRSMLHAASEMFTVRWNVRRIPEIIEDVPLEYALGMQQFGRRASRMCSRPRWSRRRRHSGSR